MKLLGTAAAIAALALVAGCSGWGSKTEDYKGAQARSNTKPLELPPDLSAPSMDDRYSVPDPRAVTSYSSYSQKPGPQGEPQTATQAGVLPRFDNVHIERAGEQRWLVVKGEPEKVWPVVREFWIDNGYNLLKEEPQLGVMETDWMEERSRIPQDWIRRTIGKFMEGLYSYPRRDKFRTRLDRGVEPGTTEIFISNRNVEEVYSSSTQDRTYWQGRPADASLEGEMLSRLMFKLGGGDTRVTTASAPLPGRRGATPVSAQEPPRNAVLQNSGAGPLVVNDSFDRAWRRVGLALDRVGFTVEDRDRSKGVFYVRYVDPEADLSATQQKTSWVDKLMFWKAPPKAGQPSYRIHVADAGANASQVVVQDKAGAAENSSTGKKILGLLYEQLK